jgi:hypothetical protein
MTEIGNLPESIKGNENLQNPPPLQKAQAFYLVLDGGSPFQGELQASLEARLSATTKTASGYPSQALPKDRDGPRRIACRRRRQ